MSAYAKLRRKRQLFVDEYVATGDGSYAAVKSGYSGKKPATAAWKILANPEVKAAVAERMDEAIARAGIRHVRVLEEAARIAFASVEQIRGPDGKALAFKDLPSGLLQGAQSVEFNSDGSVKNLKLAKVDGLRMLGQYLKLFTEVHELQGKDGGPIKTEEVSDLEKARRIAFLLNQGVRSARAASPLTDPVSGDESDV